MFLEANMGFPGGFARQVTLNSSTATGVDRAETEVLLAALESAATDESIILQGEGILIHADGTTTPKNLTFGGVTYIDRDTAESHTRDTLLDQAAAGELILTLTGRLGENVDVDHPQPELWSPVDPEPGRVRHDFQHLPGDNAMQLNARHVVAGSNILVDGKKVPGTITCRGAGTLPNCAAEEIFLGLDNIPTGTGMHLVQVQTPDGLQSNEFLFFVD